MDSATMKIGETVAKRLASDTRETTDAAPYTAAAALQQVNPPTRDPFFFPGINQYFPPKKYFEELFGKEKLPNLTESLADHWLNVALDTEQPPPVLPDEFSIGVWECENVSLDLLCSIKYLSDHDALNATTCTWNESFQELKDAPIKDIARGDNFWRSWRGTVSSFVENHLVTALNAHHLLSSHKPRYVPIGETSFLDLLTGVLVHVWQSSTAAKQFIHGWQWIWRALFEFHITGVTCPVSCAYRIQGELVTVTALPPIETSFQTANLSDSSDYPAMWRLQQRLCHALGTQKPPSFLYGLDGRYYIMSLAKVFPSLFEGAAVSHPRRELFLAMQEEQFSGTPLNFLKQTLVPRCVNSFFELFVKMERLEPVTADILLDERLIPEQLHNCGINLCFLKFVLDGIQQEPPVELSVDISPQHKTRMAQELKMAIEVEMIGRTLKSMAHADLKFGDTRYADISDVKKRVEVPNKLAHFIVSRNARFWEEHLMPLLRLKFVGCTSGFSIPMTQISAGRILRPMVEFLGVELNIDATFFTHYCSVAGTKMMCFRPPPEAQMYTQRQYSELDLSIPKLWKLCQKFPSGSNLHHSHAITAAIRTLFCHAAEKLSFLQEHGLAMLQAFASDEFLYNEILSLIGEMVHIKPCSSDVAHCNKKLHSALQQQPKAHLHDFPSHGIAHLHSGLASEIFSLVVSGVTCLLRSPLSQVFEFSATFKFGLQVARVLLERTELNHSPSEISSFFDFYREYLIRIKDKVSKKIFFAEHLAVSSSIFHAEESSSCWGHSKSLTFSQVFLQRMFSSMSRHRLTCIAGLRLALVALRLVSLNKDHVRIFAERRTTSSENKSTVVVAPPVNGEEPNAIDGVDVDDLSSDTEEGTANTKLQHVLKRMTQIVAKVEELKGKQIVAFTLHPSIQKVLQYVQDRLKKCDPVTAELLEKFKYGLLNSDFIGYHTAVTDVEAAEEMAAKELFPSLPVKANQPPKAAPATAVAKNNDERRDDDEDGDL